MGRKSKAVAATLSAIVLFLPLVVGNYLLYSSASEGALLMESADRQVAAVQDTSLLLSYTSYSALLALQGFWVATPAFCPQGRNASPIRQSYAFSGEIHGNRYNLTLDLVGTDSGPSSDNLTGLERYHGFLRGQVNLRLHIVFSLSDSPTLQYRRSEVHFLHVPITQSCFRHGSCAYGCLASRKFWLFGILR